VKFLKFIILYFRKLWKYEGEKDYKKYFLFLVTFHTRTLKKPKGSRPWKLRY